jgi:hypothetical protein
MHQEIARMTNIPYIQVNYDAKACYNRIIPDLACLISRKYGIHHNIINIFKSTIETSKYYIKLGNEVSSTYYNNSDTNTLYGTGQRSGSSPHIWTLLSSNLFHLYVQNTSGISINDPYQNQTPHIPLTAFVDDENKYHFYSNKSSISDMVKQTRTNAQRWNDILHISGGKLSGNKCTFYVGLWDHVSTGRTKINKRELMNLQIIDREGGSIAIDHIPAQQHHKSLGYLQSLGNSMKSQEY